MYFTNSLKFLKMGDVVNKFMLGVFFDAVASVQPKHLIMKHFKYNRNKDHLQVFTDVYDLKNRFVHLVGAGKAVFQMATEVEKVLGEKLKSGIVSVPIGITDKCPLNRKTVIKYYEGAQNNTPDSKSEYAAKQIKSLVESMDEKCLLLVLLTGGGSALLPSPLPPILLPEKCDLISQLSKAGADIVEMNIVRKRLSSLKGGKLSELAHPAQVISLLISDIVGNPCDSIASGPTFENHDDPSEAIKILEKYSLHTSLPSSIKEVLYSMESNIKIPRYLDISNYVLGNNTCAIDVGRIKAISEGYQTYVLTDRIHGNVQDVSADYCLLVSTVIELLSKSIDKDVSKSILKNLKNIPFDDYTLEHLAEIKNEAGSNGICLIAGGEPTVQVIGSGKGGRSQHLALSFSHNFHMERLKNEKLKKYEVTMLCAGTDGMDGPTDAAGALGYGDLTSDAEAQGLSVETFLSNHDSYNFFTEFLGGRNHIKIGHTNTNVMDIHIIVIRLKTGS